MPRPLVPEGPILQAATELFAERGYQGTTTAAIAEKAGINEVTLFRRFGSKKGVLAALAKEWSANMAGMAVDFVAEKRGVRETVAALAKMEVAGAESYGVAATRLLMEASAVPEIAEVVGTNPQDNLAGLATYLRSRQVAGEVRADLNPMVMAEAFFAMTSTQMIASRMLHLGDRTGETRDEIVRQIVEMFCTAVLTERCCS